MRENCDQMLNTMLVDNFLICTNNTLSLESALVPIDVTYFLEIALMRDNTLRKAKFCRKLWRLDIVWIYAVETSIMFKSMTEPISSSLQSEVFTQNWVDEKATMKCSWFERRNSQFDYWCREENDSVLH